MPSAQAQPRRAGGGDLAASQAHIARAQAEIAKQDWRAAETALAQAFAVKRRPDVLYYLGRIAEGEQRMLDAHDLMRRYLTDPARVPDEAAVADAQRLIGLPRPPSGQVLVLGEAGALLHVDGRLVGDLPLSQPLLLAPGEHRVAVVDKLKRQESPVSVQSGRVLEMRFKRGAGAVLISLLPALLWTRADVGVPLAAQNLLRDAADQAAGKQQQALLGIEAALPQKPGLASCVQTLRCQRELARHNELEFILDTRTRRVDQIGGQSGGQPGGATWQIEARLWHIQVDAVAAEAKKDCRACTPEQAAAQLQEATTQVLAQGLGRRPGVLSIESQPPEAAVVIAGSVVGATPYKLTGWTSQVELIVRKPGFLPVQRTAELREGEAQSEVITLLSTSASSAQPPASKPRPRRRPLWRVVTGGALLAAGVVVGGFGISGLSVDGQCYVNGGVGQCPAGAITPQYQTTALGGGLLGTGVGLAIIGAGMLAWPAQ